MLNAAVASQDPKSGENLRACLEQTGLVKSVKGFSSLGDGESSRKPVRSEPEIMLLDFSSDVRPYFDVAAQFRRAHPGGLIIACSSSPPDHDFLLQAMHAGVNEFLPKPIDHPTLEAVLERFTSEHGAADLDGARKLIIVMDVKGGVGTSTVAINLGVQLTRLSKKCTLLIDLARPLGQVALLLELEPRFSICDALENLERLDTHFLGGLLTRHNSGLQILTGTSHPDHWERLSICSIRRILNVAQSCFDFVVVDFGSVFSKQWMPVFDLARNILVVAESNVPAFSNLRCLVSAFAPPTLPEGTDSCHCQPLRATAGQGEES